MEGERNVIGVLRETKNYWECRVPLIPSDVKILSSRGIKVILQPSSNRCFQDSEYIAAGADLEEDLSQASLILGVKEVLPRNFLPGRIFMFFSHTFKAQAYNMPMLDSMIANRITLVDYECIKNYNGTRTVALGKFGGNAGVMDFLQGLGKYLLMRNMSTPFLYQGFAYMYRDLKDIRTEIAKIAGFIVNGGLPDPIVPMVWGVLGNGRCSLGVQEMLSLLPHQVLNPDQLASLKVGPESKFQIYIVVFPVQKLYSRNDGGRFNRQEYEQNPGMYESVFFNKYAKYLSVVFNCLYYESRFPRVLSTGNFKFLPKLLGVCDITCDMRGTVEVCRKFTTPEEPFFLYNTGDDRMYELCKAHVEGSILYYSMDFLPTELPRDSSTHLSHCLIPYIQELCSANFDGRLEDSGLSNDLLDSIHLYKGILTEKYKYIEELRNKSPVPHFDDADDQLRKLARILKACPHLASDVDNSRFGQELTPESKTAIIQIAKILENR
jgi:alpha-aminoadipic semialdehyde synthase